MQTVQIYSKETIQGFCWPETNEAKYAKQFLFPLITEGATSYIDNIDTALYVLSMGDIVLPITVNNAQYSNSYVCSPCAQYAGFATELFGKKSALLRSGCALMEQLLKWSGINRTVMVNNWLLSTNLYPELKLKQIELITDFLRKNFPGFTIIFRSINQLYDASLLENLKTAGYAISFNRTVYITNTKEDSWKKSRMFKSDFRLLENTDYRVLDNEEILQNKDLERIVALYRCLYLDKYSKLNPSFNTKFVETALKERLLHFKALEKNGRIDGIMGFFQRRGVTTSPFFGYDTALPQNLGLYRLIATLLALEAEKSGCWLNHSSGAASFKKLRRALPVPEYIAIDNKSAPIKQKAVWKVLEKAMGRFAAPLIQKHGL